MVEKETADLEPARTETDSHARAVRRTTRHPLVTTRVGMIFTGVAACILICSLAAHASPDHANFSSLMWIAAVAVAGLRLGLWPAPAVWACTLPVPLIVAWAALRPRRLRTTCGPAGALASSGAVASAVVTAAAASSRKTSGGDWAARAPANDSAKSGEPTTENQERRAARWGSDWFLLRLGLWEVNGEGWPLFGVSLG